MPPPHCKNSGPCAAHFGRDMSALSSGDLGFGEVG